MKIKSLFFIAAMLLALGGKAQNNMPSTKLYVSTVGNDRNIGSKASPFRSLGKALAISKKLRDKKVEVLLRQGIYYLEETLVLDAKEVTCASLEIRNYLQEEVTISAGKKLALDWKASRNGIYQAKVPSGISFERLYVNGIAQHMARYPNYDPKAKFFKGFAADAIAPERIKKWNNPAGGYVHALHGYEWGSFDYLISGKDEKGNLKMQGGWQNNRPFDMHGTYRFVENIIEELDAPGEWYLDRPAGVLYYYPVKGTDLKKAAIVVSHLKNSIVLKGTVEQPVRNVSITGLKFKHNERTFMDTKEPLLRSDWTIYRGGAVLFDGTANCKIMDCSFTGLGGNAIMVSNYNLNTLISGNYVSHVGASAVCFVGSANAVRSPLFNYKDFNTYEQIDKTPGPKTNDYPQHCIVSNNLFHDLGEIEKQATGVEISMSSEITASHNSIYNTPRAGINIGDGTWGGHVIAYNDVFNTVQETGDHGAFNSWGRDRFWSFRGEYVDSLVKIHPELILLDAVKQTVIHDNRFRCDRGWDIDLDDGSSNYLIYNNVCLNGGLKLREGFYRIVKNNILVNNTFHPHVWFANSGDVFQHNIVSKPYEPIGINDWGGKVDSNFFISAVGLKNAQKLKTDLQSIAGDPLFLSADRGDYTVSGGSPALSIGFKNIRMDQFGVQKPALKKIALRPKISALVIRKEDGPKKSPIVSFLGGQLKAVDGLGERSSYGLPDEKGVIIVSAGQKSLLAASGLMDRDVIKMVDGKMINGLQDLIKEVELRKGKSYVAIEFIRNQVFGRTDLKLK